MAQTGNMGTPVSTNVCCLKCFQHIVINQLHLVPPALLWCPLTHYHWCTATDKVHNTHTESNGETRKYCTYTHKHTYDDNKNNKMADAKGPGRGSLLFPVLVWWWLSLQSQNTSAVVWRGTGRFISVRTHRDAHTNILGKVVRLNTLSFSLQCYLFFRSVSFSFFLDMTSQATKCHCVVWLGLKSPLQTHTHTVARPGVKIFRADNRYWFSILSWWKVSRLVPVLWSSVLSIQTDMLSQEAMTGGTVQHTVCLRACVRPLQMASHHLGEAEISRVYGLR